MNLMPNNIYVALSALADGSMSKAVEEEERRINQEKFLRAHDVPIERTVLVHLKYEDDDYCRYYTVSSENAGEGMTTDSALTADALFTREKNLALFLPVADCIGSVLYDTRMQVLGLAHFGRHNLVQFGGTKVIEYMRQEYGSEAADVTAWLSPAAGRERYPLHDFNNRGLHEVAMSQLIDAGIPQDNITVDMRDTAKDPRFFSHSEFLKGNRPSDGRQAVVAEMRP